MNDADFLLETFVGACRLLAKYNTVTGELEILKDSGNGQIPGEIVDSDTYIREILESGAVYKEDIAQFDLLFDKSFMQNLYDEHQNGSLLVYRRRIGEKLIWTRLNMFVPKCYSMEEPWVVVFNRDMPADEAMIYEAWGLLGQQVYKVVRINHTVGETFVIKEYPGEKVMRRKLPDTSYETEIRWLTTDYVHPDDAAAFTKHLQHEYIRNYFREGNTEYQFYYRRKIRTLYRWVRLTVIPASDYSADNEVFYYYVNDVHKMLLKILDIRAATNYAYFFSKRNERFSEGYYENLLEILSYFTQKYIDYYMIDLDKDLYINYKLSGISSNAEIPGIGRYSQMSSAYLKGNYSGEEAKVLRNFSSSEKLKELLKDKMTLEYTFTYPDGRRVTTSCVKLESKNGIPTKVLCSTLPAKEDDRLVLRTFGNFEVYRADGTPVHFARKQSKHLLAYLTDRQGYPVTSRDIVTDILEKDPSDLNAVKYVSTLVRRAMDDLNAAGYPDVIIKEAKSVRINVKAVDCDYYHFMQGDSVYWQRYHNEYMKEYSWAEETNAELLNITNG